MLLTKNLNTTGEHPFLFSGKVGKLETVLSVPDPKKEDYVAIIGHPHSLQGGTMNNKVVTTLVRVFKELGIPSLRFNFRGVGQSEGTYDEGIGESEDMLAFAHQWRDELPDTKIIFAGFSFGSYVAYRAAACCEHELLITIAPPIHHYNYKEFTPIPTPWLVVQGDMDDVVPAELVFKFAEDITPPLSVIRFPETGHFFHGKLIDLKTSLLDAITIQVADL